MNYHLEIHEAVGDDVENARLTYEQLRQGLGDDLFTEIYTTMAKLEENPHLFQHRYGKFRIAMTSRFRFNIVYRIEDKTVYVIAVRHPSRHPTSWMERL